MLTVERSHTVAPPETAVLFQFIFLPMAEREHSEYWPCRDDGDDDDDDNIYNYMLF